MVIFAVLIYGSFVMAGDKKSGGGSAPAAHSAPASHSSAPSGGGAHPSSAGGASHGPTTGGASHGPTTGGASASHGPTTSSPHGSGVTTSSPHGATTAGGSHGATTAGGSHGTTTAGGTHGAMGTTGASHGPGGASTAHTTGGMHAGAPAPKGSNVRTASNGSSVRTRANGQRSDVHNAQRNMDIHHGLNGGRTVSQTRADGSRVVAGRGGRGYVERGYGYHGHDFARRSYYYNGHYYNAYYRGYYYGGYPVNVYAPAYYWGPAYYGWAYNPWPAPIVYGGWGWAGNPWYGYYGGWWNPYPVYAGASFWLTDYLISQSLQSAYQDQADAAAAAAANTAAMQQAAMTADTKALVAEEVKRQIALENSEAQQVAAKQDVDPGSSGIGRMLSDNQTHVFIAGSSLDVTDTSGAECAISQGDVLEVTSAPASGASAATATVLCSKGGKECPKAAQVQLAFADLQDMQNHMRQTIDQGMGDLQSKQGQGGLPTVPPSAKAAATQADYVAAAPPPEQNVADAVKQTSAQADQAETEVAQAVAPGAPGTAGGNGNPAAPAAAPVTVSQGQTVDQVTAALGQPKSVVNLGTKKIYVYQDMKVTFKDGKVSDVQ